MDRQTLSNYGWIVIVVLILAVMLAFATPFGKYIGTGVSNLAMSMVGANDNAVDKNNIEQMGKDWHNYLNNIDPALNPDDGTTPVEGDVYVYEDYEYRYNQYYNGDGITDFWSSNNSQNGWGVRCINNVADPGPILESINGEPITNMYKTFYRRTALTTAPTIPSSVINMGHTFQGCYNLSTYDGNSDSRGDFSGYVIPYGVTNMTGTFNDTGLKIAPKIPNSVVNMNRTFYSCDELTTASAIPNSVTNINGTYSWCTGLTGTITIDVNPTYWTECLYKTNITAVVGSTTMADDIMLTKTSTVTNPTA